MRHPGVVVVSGADTDRDQQPDSGVLRFPNIAPIDFGRGFGLGRYGTGTYGA